MCDFLLVRHCNYSIASYLTLNNITVRGHSMSLKLVSFESLGAVSYSSSVVPMTISCIACEI